MPCSYNRIALAVGSRRVPNAPMGTRGTYGTPRRRTAFIAAIAAGKSVEDAAKLIGAGRRTVYHWRADHEEFAREWDDARGACADKMEAVLTDIALGGDTEALKFMLRARKPETYNPNLLIRQQMLQLALERARAEASYGVRTSANRFP